MCFGSTNSCQTTTATSIPTPGQQSAGASIAAAGQVSPNADDFNSLNTALSPGCSTSDLLFTNFTGNLNPNGTGLVNVNSGTYISTGSNQNLTAGQVDVIFSDIRGTDNGADLSANDGVNSWFAARATTTTVVTDYQVNTTDIIRDFSLNLEGVLAGQGAGLAVTGTVNLCLGGSWNAGGTGTTCSSGVTQVITLANGTNNYNVVLNVASAVIGVQNTFVLLAGNSGTSGGIPAQTYLTSFDESFAVSPEPSTFALFGIALAGVAAFRVRRRKQS